MTNVTLDHNAISDLISTLKGYLITPKDAAYDEARAIFYGGMDRHPALIVRVANDADVSKVISFARDTGMELAVRSGGHSIAGQSVVDGGVVIDLSQMKALEIDPEARTAWAETGLTAGEVTNAAAAYGLAIGFGDTGSVGIGGITLGGGIGYLVRKYGLTIDSLQAADIVTADGQALRVDADNHPDLFWAIRGGGGNFGVATRFKYQLHKVDKFVGGMMMLPATPDTVASFIALSEAAPDELSTIANVMPAPPMPFVPADQHGKLAIMALMSYAGEIEEGQRVMAPFRELATPIVDMVHPMPYPQIYPPEDEGYKPVAASLNMFINSVDRNTAEMMLDRLKASTAQMAVTQIRVLGGAAARVPDEATAYAHRNSRIMVNLAALYGNPQEAATHKAWVADFAKALNQGDNGVYVNFLSDEGEARVRAAYPGSTWDRLVAIKRRYDPTNLFHHNQNIPPGK